MKVFLIFYPLAYSKNMIWLCLGTKWLIFALFFLFSLCACVYLCAKWCVFILFMCFSPRYSLCHLLTFFSSSLISIWPYRQMFPINHSQTCSGAPSLLHVCLHAGRKCYTAHVRTVDLFITLSTQTQTRSVREGKGMLLGWALGSGGDGPRFGLSSSPAPTPVTQQGRQTQDTWLWSFSFVSPFLFAHYPSLEAAAFDLLLLPQTPA